MSAAELVTELLSTAPPLQHGVSRQLASDKRYRGGDLFAYCPLANGSSNILIADVSSKGRAGILHAEMLLDRFLRLSMNGSHPATILSELNGLRFDVAEANAGTVFASAFVGTITPARAELRYASAGHELALVFRGRAHMHLEPTGPVLGVFSDAVYALSRMTFVAGDLLLLATDGITESRRAADPARQFGTTGLVHAVDATRGGTAATFARRVMSASESFCESNRRDDATVAVLCYKTP